jgi:hypothetical protein
MVSPWKPWLVLSVFFLTPVFWSGAASHAFAAAPAPTPLISYEKEMITLGGKKISVEIAKTEEQHQQGLMFRKSLPAQAGMLFIFKDEQVRNFWMKNTIIDLSIGYFNKDQVLIDVQEMVPLSPMDVRPVTYPSAKPAMYALEMNKGWFAKNKIKTGQKFQFDRRRQ